jgi:hypothetical protein
LGNVQATVSDKRYVQKQYLSTTDSLRKGFAVAVRALYDYYPFGMPMKERSTSDTTTQSVYMSQVVYSPQYTKVNNAMSGASITSLNTTASTNYNGSVNYTGQSASISKVLSSLLPNVPVQMKIDLLYTNKPLYLAIQQGSAASPSVYTNLLYSTTMNSSGTYTISFTPTQSSVQLSIAYSSFNMNANTLCFTLDSVNYQQQSASVSSTQLVQVSNKINDGYRFGYNGQEKVDEIAGAGNHNTAEFWEYDTRLGRRWNRDPVVKPWESSYACFANNPIWYSDVNGDDGTKTSSGNGYMTGDLNNVVVRSSKLDPDKKEDDGEKSSGGGGGGAAAGGGPNSKHSVGADQLRKYSPLLQAQGFGIADNGGGSGGAGGGEGSGEDTQGGGGGSGLGTWLSGFDFAAGVYSEYVHNHTTYTTTKGIEKNIIKANGQIRSARAARFARASNLVRGVAVVGSVLSTGYSTLQVYNQWDAGGIKNVNGWDATDAGVGMLGLGATGAVYLGLMSNPVGWGIGVGVLIYSGSRLAYDLNNEH